MENATSFLESTDDKAAPKRAPRARKPATPKVKAPRGPRAAKEPYIIQRQDDSLNDEPGATKLWSELTLLPVGNMLTTPVLANESDVKAYLKKLAEPGVYRSARFGKPITVAVVQSPKVTLG